MVTSLFSTALNSNTRNESILENISICNECSVQASTTRALSRGKFTLLTSYFLILFSLFGTGSAWGQCTFRLQLKDSYGDGWQGNVISSVKVNGVTVLSNKSNTSGTGWTGNGTFLAYSGETIAITYDNSGSYCSENSYRIQRDDAGTWNTVYTSGTCPTGTYSITNNGCTSVCPINGDEVTYGSGSWIGYVYQSNSAGLFSTYKGYITESETFNRTHTAPTGASSSLCSPGDDLFAIRYRMTKNFPAGYYKFTIGGDDGVRLSLDGGSTWHINDWTNHGYTTYTSSSAVYLSGNTNLVFEYYENTGGAQSSFSYIMLPTNDACSNATTLTVGASAISGTLTNATYESPFTDKKEVWYQITPSCTGDHSITLNGLVDDKDLYVYSGSCGSLSQINYSATSGSSAEYITSPFNSGVTYYLAVYDWENTGGTFNIGVSGPPAPSQPSIITGTLDPVPGSTQVYSVTNVSGVTYTWIFPSGWTITGGQNTNSVTVTVGSTNGTIKVTPSNGCGSGTERTATSVIPTYRAQIISASYGSNDWCSGEERNVTVQIKNTGIGTWNSGYTTNIGVKWNNWSDYHSRVTAGSLAPGSTQTYTLPIKAMNATGGPSYSTNLSAGSYTLVFDVVNESSCWFGNNSGSCGPGNSIYSTSSINVKSIPSNVTAGSDNSICSGNSTILNGSATAPNGLITIVSDNFSSNTGWSLGSGWSIASATASSSCSGTYQDPSTDYTSNTSDNKILGYVIGGCYESSLASAVYATSPAYNLTGYTNVSLSFYRILGIESSTYDHASIDVYNGTSWVNIYNHNAGSFSDASWTNFSYDISAYVNANFKVRFGIGSTDGSVQYCGWNIDDFSITGIGALSVSYSWTGTNIISGGTTSQPTVNPTSSQTYTMTATSNGCSVTDDVTITVKNPTFSTQPQATSICSNGTGSFSVATNAVAPTFQWQYSSDNFNWANTDGASGVSGHTTNTLSLTNPDITWNGLYIRCVLTSEGCSKNSNAVVLTVNTPPTTVSVTGGGAICSGNSASLSASNGSSGTIYWQGNTSGGTSTATASTSQSVSNAGTYYFRARSAEGCWGTQGSASISISQPSTSISVNNTSIANGDYLWNGNTSTDGSLASNWYVLNNSVYSPASTAPTSADEVFIVDFLDGGSCISSSNDVSTPASGTFNSKHVFIGDGAALSLGANSTLNVTGNFTNDGTFTPGTGTVNFTGTAATQTISGTGSLNFSNVTINKSAGEVSLSNDISVSGALTLNNGNLNLNGKTLNYSGGNNISTSSGIIGSSTGSKLNFTGTSPSQINSNLFVGDIYDLALADGSNVSSDGTYTITNSLTIGTGATFSKSDGQTLSIKGNIINNGTIIDGTDGFGGSFIFNNDGDQTISGQPISVVNFQVTKNSGNLNITTPVTVTGTLTMNKGNIINSQLITIGTSSINPGSISYNASTGGAITGALRRYFDASATPGSGYYFPVGNASNTRGATVDFTSSPGSNQYLTVQYVNGYAGGATPLNAGLPLTTADGVLIQNFDNEGYWEINPTADNYGSSINSAPYTISLQMKNLTGVNDRSTVRIIKAAGSSTPAQHHSTWSALTFGATPVTGTSNSDFSVTGTSSGFSWFGAGSGNNNPLPVELVSFTGACEEGIINLTWQTASEFNSSHFDVEKSRDGENWQVLTTLPSAGTSNELITYQSTDQNGKEGNNYFRLRQVDIDGTEKLYDPINVSCSEVTAGYFSSFPNPSGTSFQVIVNNKELVGTCALNIVDATGKLIEQREIEMKDGINMFVVSQEMTPGIYFLNISNGSKSTPVLRHAIK